MLASACLVLLVACTTQATNIPETPTLGSVAMPTIRPSSPTTTPKPSTVASRAPGGVVIVERLDLRAGPGFRYDKAGELRKGEEFDIIARWCGYSEDDNWYLIGISGVEQRWVLGSSKYVSTRNAEHLACLVPPPTATTTPVNPNLRVDRMTIAPGECVTLRWDADSIQAIYLNGESTVRHGTRRVCPPQTRTYVVTVIEHDGRRNDYELTLQVASSPASAKTTLLPPGQTTTPMSAETIAPRSTITAMPTSAFPQVVAGQAGLTEFKLAIGRYRLAEKEALKSPDSAALEQLSDFAHGEALAAVLDRVEQLKAQGHHAELIVQQMDVQTAVLQDDQTAGVLVQEKRTLRTYQPSVDGDRLIEEEVFEGRIVYGLTHLDSHWKVERIRSMSSDTADR